MSRDVEVHVETAYGPGYDNTPYCFIKKPLRIVCNRQRALLQATKSVYARKKLVQECQFARAPLSAPAFALRPVSYAEFLPQRI